jgi:transposase-like protein
VADEIQAQRPRRRHSSEFKAQVIQDYGQAGVSIRPTAQLHSVDPSLVRHWLAVHRAQAGTVCAAAKSQPIVRHRPGPMEVNGKFLAVEFDKQNSADKLTLALERIDWV